MANDINFGGRSNVFAASRSQRSPLGAAAAFVALALREHFPKVTPPQAEDLLNRLEKLSQIILRRQGKLAQSQHRD